MKYNSQHLRYGPKNTQTRARGNITYCIKQQRQTATEIMKRNVQHASVCVPIRPCVDANPCCVSPLRFTKRERETSNFAHTRARAWNLFFHNETCIYPIPYRFAIGLVSLGRVLSPGLEPTTLSIEPLSQRKPPTLVFNQLIILKGERNND